MKSKITIAKHPVHPMLVSFPIALYAATFFCFVAFELNADPFWFDVALVANVAGIIMALVASIPGVIDWALAIPEDHPAKNTGAYHLAFNLLAFALFTVNAWLNVDQWNMLIPIATGVVYLSGLGLLSTIIAGFLGWKLVQTHHVGVDLTEKQAAPELIEVHEFLEEEKRPRAG